MGALLSMIANGASVAGGGVSAVLGTVTSIFSFSVDAALAILALFVELGGYAFTAVSATFTLFIGCCMPVLSEVMMPASEWNGSEAKRSGPLFACVSCLLVCSCIVAVALIVAFSFTSAWYEGELLAGNEELKQQLDGAT